MATAKDKYGRFTPSEGAKLWQAQNKERYAALCERYPNLLIRRAVLAMIGQGNTKTMAQIREGLFPRACMDSPKRWREADLRAWLEENAKA